MSQISKELINDALALSTNERVALVEQLLQSLNAPNNEIVVAIACTHQKPNHWIGLLENLKGN